MIFSSIFRAPILFIIRTPILCCTTTDLGIFWYCSGDFWSCICESPELDTIVKVINVKFLLTKQLRALECGVGHMQATRMRRRQFALLRKPKAKQSLCRHGRWKDFCKGGQQWWTIFLQISKLGEKHFSTTKLLGNYQISTSREEPRPPFRHLCLSICPLFSSRRKNKKEEKWTWKIIFLTFPGLFCFSRGESEANHSRDWSLIEVLLKHQSLLNTQLQRYRCETNLLRDLNGVNLAGGFTSNSLQICEKISAGLSRNTNWKRSSIDDRRLVGGAFGTRVGDTMMDTVPLRREHDKCRLLLSVCFCNRSTFRTSIFCRVLSCPSILSSIKTFQAFRTDFISKAIRGRTEKDSAPAKAICLRTGEPPTRMTSAQTSRESNLKPIDRWN